MGYSATANAIDRLNMIMRENDNASSNTWDNGDTTYFYEIGRENSDGSVTGSVYEIRGKYARKKGGFKIDSYGKVLRFPGLTKKMREAGNRPLPVLLDPITLSML